MILSPASLVGKESVAELTAHLRSLIRIDTTNPPGNETAAARYIADVFKREGIDSTIIEPAPNRGNIIVRLKGDGSKRPLLLIALGLAKVSYKDWFKWVLPIQLALMAVCILFLILAVQINYS